MEILDLGGMSIKSISNLHDGKDMDKIDVKATGIHLTIQFIQMRLWVVR
jgi:hypothetical protein